MDRRRYLQAAGASVAPLLAGCSTDAFTETATEAPTRTPTATDAPTPTETETEQYVDSPGDVEIPQYIELLPDKHLGGTERTNNANFVRVDWEWYLRMREEPMEFGAAAELDWTLKPTEENFATAPEYDILKGPVNAVLTTAFIIENIIGEFPNAGPEILRQCGLEGAEDGQGSNPEVEEVISYAQPGVMYFVGVNTESFKSAVQENDSRSYDNVNITGYRGTDKSSDRTFLLSEVNSTGIVAFESAAEKLERLRPTLERLAGYNESVKKEESVRWCLSRLNEAPVVTGEINGGRQKTAGKAYEDRDVSNLSNPQTIFQGFSTTGTTAESQLIASQLDGPAPLSEELREFYAEGDSSESVEFHPNVSAIYLTW
jgi:hypothetical protein